MTAELPIDRTKITQRKPDLNWGYPETGLDTSSVSLGEPNNEGVIEILDANGAKMAEVIKDGDEWRLGDTLEVTPDVFDNMVALVDGLNQGE